MQTLFRKLKNHLADPFKGRETKHVPELPGSAQALLAWWVKDRAPGAVVFIVDGPQMLESAHHCVEVSLSGQ